MSVGNPIALGPCAPVVVANTYLNATATTLVKTGDGYLAGVWVASGTPTLKLWDSLTATGAVIINTSTLSLGWNPIPAHFTTGLFATVGSTGDLTFFYL